MKVGDKYTMFDRQYIVTEVTTDYDPYLMYCKHFKAVSMDDEKLEYGGALTDYPNPFCDINAAINGTKPSKYV